jgi:hypothetical protein
MNLKDKCVNGKFRTSEHKTILEHLRLQADRFRKQGRLQENEMEAIIKEMREEPAILTGQRSTRE